MGIPVEVKLKQESKNATSTTQYVILARNLEQTTNLLASQSFAQEDERSAAKLASFYVAKWQNKTNLNGSSSSLSLSDLWDMTY
nr:hypothetical protein Iba_chr11dCG7150 [Ipomoea batatas]GMD58745.1 hypothetical protein Iba_chr11fCG8520 [Ipomoea batatas]